MIPGDTRTNQMTTEKKKQRKQNTAKNIGITNQHIATPTQWNTFTCASLTCQQLPTILL